MNDTPGAPMEANASFAEWLDGEEFGTLCLDYRGAQYAPVERGPQACFERLMFAIKREHAKENADLLAALQALLERYVRLIDSGDCGNWDSATEAEVIQARAVLARATA